MDKDENYGLNPAITRCPVILFTGAGASTALGFNTTKKFMAKVEEVVSENTLYEEIYRGWQTETNESDLDIEHLLDHLDSCLDDTTLAKRNKLRVARFKGDVLKLVVDHYSDVNAEKAGHLYFWLFMWLKAYPPEMYPLLVFTTNYDWIFERAISSYKSSMNLVDGFRTTKMGTYWDAKTFKNFKGTKFGWDFVYFKLHGSTSWYQQQDGRIVKTTHAEMDPGRLRTMLIYPTLAKRKQVDAEPYSTCYKYLKGCLSTGAVLCVVIGFSFRDREINEVIQSAVRVNRNVQFLVVDPHPNETHVLNVLNLKKARVEFIRDKFKYYGMNTNKVLRSAIERRMSKDSLMFRDFNKANHFEQFDQLKLMSGFPWRTSSR